MRSVGLFRAYCRSPEPLAHAMCSRTVQGRACSIPLWKLSLTASRNATLPRCAINSPYMEEGSKRPDVPKVAQATVRAAAGEALRLLPGLPVVAGGKSFGGRMTSQAQAASSLSGVQGLVFL